MEQQNTKSLKEYAREAKNRLKSGFWQNYHKNLQEEIDKATSMGVSVSKVKEYYENKVNSDIKSHSISEEEFYQKVKVILENEGEISGIIGRLTDKEYYDTLSYEEKQRYTFSLSERYIKALERFKKENIFENKVL